MKEGNAELDHLIEDAERAANEMARQLSTYWGVDGDEKGWNSERNVLADSLSRWSWGAQANILGPPETSSDEITSDDAPLPELIDMDDEDDAPLPELIDMDGGEAYLLSLIVGDTGTRSPSAHSLRSGYFTSKRFAPWGMCQEEDDHGAEGDDDGTEEEDTDTEPGDDVPLNIRDGGRSSDEDDGDDGGPMAMVEGESEGAWWECGRKVSGRKGVRRHKSRAQRHKSRAQVPKRLSISCELKKNWKQLKGSSGIWSASPQRTFKNGRIKSRNVK